MLFLVYYPETNAVSKGHVESTYIFSSGGLCQTLGETSGKTGLNVENAHFFAEFKQGISPLCL